MKKRNTRITRRGVGRLSVVAGKVRNVRKQKAEPPHGATRDNSASGERTPGGQGSQSSG